MSGENGSCPHKRGKYSTLKTFLLLIVFMSQLQKQVELDLGSLIFFFFVLKLDDISCRPEKKPPTTITKTQKPTTKQKTLR